MVEPEPRPTAGQRLGAQESLGISTLDPGHKPPAMPPGRQVSVRVHLLDDTEEVFEVSQRASGRALLDLVCAHLNLIEGDYFGLEYQNHRKMTVWLDLLKPIIKQIRRPKHTVLRFVVKFFPPDHTQLLEELTRYLFALQVKQDLACGVLTCNDSSAALLVSHIVQSEIGDFDETQSREHLLTNRYMPDQEALLDRIMDCHRKHTGQTPAESDYQLLEIARRLEMYGMRLHPAKDREGTKLSLAVAHTGVLVFQGHTRINAFNWSKIRKLSFKRKRFLIKLRPDLNQSAYQDTLEFLMGSRDCCKVFWKICVEYHAFFRLFEEPKPKPKPVLFTRGSSFRFSGRTQKQVFDYVRDSEFKKIPFERKHSRVQSHSSQSPLPSLQRPQVPKESVISSSGDELDSPSRSGWRETVSVSVEDSSASRKKSSPSPQRNGREERAGPRVEPSPSGQRAERLSTGPARRAAQAGPAPIPYTDHSSVDNEREPSPPRPRPARPRPRTYEYYFEEDEPVVRGGGVNGGYRRVHRRSVGYREHPTFHCPELTDEDPVGVSPYGGVSTHGGMSPYGGVATHGGVSPYRGVSTYGGVSPYGGMSPYGGVSTHGGVSPYGGVSPPSPYNSTLVDELFRGSVHRCPPVARCTDQFGPAEENGQEPWPAPWDEDGYDGGDRDFNPRPVLDEGPHYGRCSPATPRSSRSKKSLGPAPVPAHQPRPVFSRAERMAALERRMLANGLSTPGLSKPRPHLDHIGAVQMIDGSGSSGSESSESEMGGSSGRRLSCGDSAPSGGPSRTPLPRNKFSFGSLQLEEEVEEDGGFDFSDEDGARVFSC